MQTKFANAFDSLTRQVKALRQTPLEKDVTDATSNDNWGVANSALIELARATNDYTNYAVVMKGVWEGVGDKKERWRRVFKSLVLLEYCIKNGSDRCGDEARSELHKIRSLEDFKFMEEGRDKGAGIRDKAKQLVELLSDAELLKAEKAKARESKDKYVGIASNSAGGQTIVAPSGYVDHSHVDPTTRGTAVSTEETNGTSKLDEYRERDRIRQEAAKKKAQPVLSNAGKVVIPNRLKAPVSSSSSSSSSEEDDLIDFGSPKVTSTQHVPVQPQQLNAPQTAAPQLAQPANPYSAYPHSAPAYGQPAPAYAQSPPAYGQPAPAYTHSAPAYGQPASAYAPSPPAYGQPASAYGQSAPTYQQAPAYAQPSYGQSIPSYGQAGTTNPYSTPQYGQANNPYASVAQPVPQYGQPAQANPYAQMSSGQYRQGAAVPTTAPQQNVASNPFAFTGL